MGEKHTTKPVNHSITNCKTLVGWRGIKGINAQADFPWRGKQDEPACFLYRLLHIRYREAGS